MLWKVRYAFAPLGFAASLMGMVGLVDRRIASVLHVAGLVMHIPPRKLFELLLVAPVFLVSVYPVVYCCQIVTLVHFARAAAKSYDRYSFVPDCGQLPASFKIH